MDFSGEYRIPAPRPAVWEALNDPEILKQCIDGCESLDRVSDTELTAKLKAKVGPVSAKFNGTVTLSDMNPPERYVISGQGQGGAAGFVKGSATVTLTEDGADATVLTYASQATVGGKLASVGGRLVKGVASKTADDFFRKFSEQVSAAQPVPTPAPAPAEVTPESVPVSVPASADPAPVSAPEPVPGPAWPAPPARPLPLARVPPLTTPPPMMIPIGTNSFAVVVVWCLLALAVLGGAILVVS